MINATHVHKLFMDSLLMLDQTDNDAMCISIYTCRGPLIFNPIKIDERADEIYKILQELPEVFWESSGGGYTFLKLPFTKDDHQWGEQSNADELMALGLATGYMQYLFPRFAWNMLPGAVPYVVIHEQRMSLEYVSVSSAKDHVYSITPIVNIKG